jgi:hypothetical protein
MDFRTQVHISKPLFSLSYEDETMLIGSCFAENIGSKLEENKFITDVNPFGTLYNPASIVQSIRMLLRPERFTSSDLFEHQGGFHSFAHHSRFSSHQAEEALDKINSRLFTSAENLRRAGLLIITFGTAFAYRLKNNGQIVSNCHKLPDPMFVREMLPVEYITREWNALLPSVWEQIPALKILFTVSPIRHQKDGAHQNQLSKATILLAVNRLQELFPGRIDYFPAYEIMMDELRDYRFYADDMLHPSSPAIEYIWEVFSSNYLTGEAKIMQKEWQRIKKAINHKPFQPQNEDYRQFLSQTLLKIEHLNRKFPYFDFSKEIDELRDKI